MTLTVTFEDGGIRVKTNGINEDVIAYCQQTYGDGITFEVWNYFNDALTSSELKGYLDQSTIEFLTKCPDMYVNAFNKDADGNKFEWDCDCSIVDSQRSQYGPAEQGKHYNESPYNDKYYNNNYDRGSGQQE